MSDKDKLDDEIEQELEDRLEDSDDAAGDDDDFTVKVSREDYTVKRRFYDKGKALETADSLRMDKKNIVEDNIDHDFVTLIEDEDDVDWDNLVDGGLSFDPPISDAAQKKLDEASKVADELAAESALVESELDKTMTVSSKKKIDYPKIEPKEKETGIEEEKISEAPAPDIEPDIEIDDFDGDETDDEIIDETFEDEEPGTPVKNTVGKTGGVVKKLAALLIVIAAVAGGYYFISLPSGETETPPVVQKQPVAQKRVVTPEKMPVQPVPPKPVRQPEPEKVVEKTAPAAVEALPEPVQPEVIIPEVKTHYPYTIHISSYKSQEKASLEVARFRKKGYNAFSAYIEIPGKGGWRRIYSGYYETFTQATAAAKKLKAKLREDAIVAKTLFGVQLGSVAEKSDLADIEKRLQAKGYSSYYIPLAPDGNYVRLFAGAYKKEADAKGLFDKLVKDGFDAEIVKR